MNKTQFCQICKENNRPSLCPGFLVSWGAVQLDECPFCKNKNLITFDISEDDILIIGKISSDSGFLEAMINLKQQDPIEYQLKLSQFKAVQAQQSRKVEDNTPKCPTCSSTNLKKITNTSKVINTAMFGIFGTKQHKTYHCNNCGYEW